ncbi:hypothetical protein PIB30_061902 [Stylosanthes scabra]|uniref:Uncharacterized protein n=1 Tax=Stylosanthes scabra TaxID=79078 RepID=A0ABU6WJ97_9FABA|nr:hypothetical protein [Stylosanthes scabra]
MAQNVTKPPPSPHSARFWLAQNMAITRSIPSQTNPSLKHLTFPDTHTLPPLLSLAFQRGPNVDCTSPSQSLAHKPSSLTQEPSPAFPTHVGHPKRGTNVVPTWDMPPSPTPCHNVTSFPSSHIHVWHPNTLPLLPPKNRPHPLIPDLTSPNTDPLPPMHALHANPPRVPLPPHSPTFLASPKRGWKRDHLLASFSMHLVPLIQASSPCSCYIYIHQFISHSASLENRESQGCIPPSLSF